MQNSRRTEVVVGLVSIVGVAVLVVGILLGKGCSFSPSIKSIQVQLQSSGGLDLSSPVVINGVKRGRVIGVKPDNGKVLATIEVDNLDDLHADAHALVSILEITGGKKLEIFPGTDPAPFDTKKLMPGRAAIDLGGLVTIVGDMSGDLVTLLRRLDTITSVVTELMADGTVADNLKAMSADGAILVRDARIWMQEHRDDLSASISELKKGLIDIRRVVNNTEPKLASTLDKLDLRLSDLEVLLAKGDRAISNADSVVLNINGMINDVKTNRSFANAVLYDTTFRKQMDELSHKLDRFVHEATVNGINVNVAIGHK